MDKIIEFLKKNKIAVVVSILVLSIVSYNGFMYFNDKSKTIVDRENFETDKRIVVLGSEPEAITAAVINARLGYQVDLITEDENLGGLFTEGMLTAFDINYEHGKKILHEGLFYEFNKNAGNGFNLDLYKTQNYFDEVVKHPNINLVKEVSNITPVVDENGIVIGVSYDKGEQNIKIGCDFVFDGSHEAEFTRKLGAEYRTGRSEFGTPETYAAAGIMFSLQDVDWSKMSRAINAGDDKETGVTKNAAWGFKEMYDYVPVNDTFKMRGLNISRQDDGSIVLNALLVLGVDPTNQRTYETIVEEAHEEIPLITEYMREHLVGFENAKVDKIASDLYIREGVRIVGEETLDGYDIIAHTEFDDVIGYGSYPADLQTATKENYGNALSGNSIYEVPLGIMMPKGIENVVVLGRCASFDIVAHSSARTVPVLMSMSQGASYAVDYALQNNISLSEVRENHMDEVHEMMVKFGKMNMPTMPGNDYEDFNSNESIRFLRQKGLLTTKYFGTLPVGDVSDIEQVRMIVNLAREYTQIPFTDVQIEMLRIMEGEVEKEDVMSLVSLLTNEPLRTDEDLRRVLSEETLDYIESEDKLLNDHLYTIMEDFVRYMQGDFVEVIKQEELNVISQ